MKLLRNVVRVAAISLIALGVSSNLALADSSGSIDKTGSFSDNKIETRSSSRVNVRNDNRVDIDNQTKQFATSGDATVRNNVHGGSARSGLADSMNTTLAIVDIENDTDIDKNHGQDGSISHTGAYSRNQVKLDAKTRTDVTNKNRVDIDNKTVQYARSGDATVKGNVKGGSAKSGDAINDNWTEMDVRVSNTANVDSSGHGQDGSISHTGHFSKNKVDMDSRTHTTVRNDNRVDIDNQTKQFATSGDATVRNNVHGGSARSGDAINTNTTNVFVGIANATN